MSGRTPWREVRAAKARLVLATLAERHITASGATRLEHGALYAVVPAGTDGLEILAVLPTRDGRYEQARRVAHLTRAEADDLALVLLAATQELDRRELNARFADQEGTRRGAVDEVAATLDRLDGTAATAVSELTGRTPAELDDLGGVPPDPTTQEQT